MTLFTLGEVSRATDGYLLDADPGTRVEHVVTDSRKAVTGSLFVALAGEHTDGHRYVNAALEQGAVAALVSDRTTQGPRVLVKDTLAALGALAAYHRRRFQIPVVGVTGSVGKTTVKEMIWAVLSALGPVLKTEKNYNTEIGVPLALLDLRPTHRAAVIEMAMRGPGQIAYLCEMAAPSIGVITNIGQTHMELLGSQEAIVRAKGELLDYLGARGIAVLNRDDRYSQELGEKFSGQVFWYGRHSQADVRVVSFDGRQVTLSSPEGTYSIRLPVPGLHNAVNAAAAWTTGMILGADALAMVCALETMKLPEMRLETITLGGLTIINDAYNAAPVSCKAALDVLRSTPGDRKIAVLGNMLELGDVSMEGHREVGAYASFADYVVCVGELTRVTAEEARARGTRALHFDTNVEAAGWLRERVRPGDVLLVKGSRGARMEEIVKALIAHLGGEGR